MHPTGGNVRTFWKVDVDRKVGIVVMRSTTHSTLFPSLMTTHMHTNTRRAVMFLNVIYCWSSLRVIISAHSIHSSFVRVVCLLQPTTRPSVWSQRSRVPPPLRPPLSTPPTTSSSFLMHAIMNFLLHHSFTIECVKKVQDFIHTNCLTVFGIQRFPLTGPWRNECEKRKT